MINLMMSNLGIRRLWRDVECDLDACKWAPRDVAGPWRAATREFQLVDSRDITQMSKKEYLQVVMLEVEKGRDFLLAAKNRGREPRITVGGDHMISLPSVLADLVEYPVEDVGLLIFDSHDDFNLSADSATGNFHGMWMRPLVTKFDEAAIEKLVPEKLKVAQILYVGNLDMEEKTQRWFERLQIQVLDEKAWKTDFERSRQQVQDFMEKWGRLHLTFDLDVVGGKCDLTEATSGNWAVNLPYEGGMPLALVKKIWASLRAPENVSLDVVEYNDARLAGCEKTLKLARQIIKSVIE